jgi:menaquinone-9 beta-reductase
MVTAQSPCVASDTNPVQMESSARDAVVMFAAWPPCHRRRGQQRTSSPDDICLGRRDPRGLGRAAARGGQRRPVDAPLPVARGHAPPGCHEIQHRPRTSAHLVQPRSWRRLMRHPNRPTLRIGHIPVCKTQSVAHDHYDIAIVGAGPAGSVAAYAAARRGFSVALIDRQTFPRDKTCGDGIGPAAVRVARRLGIEDVFDGYTPVETVTVFGPNGSRSDSAIPDIDGQAATGFVIPRLEFDNRLFQKAMKAGAEDFSGIRFLNMTARTTERTVQLRNGDGTAQTIGARLVLGADGAHSAVRRALVEGRDPRRSKHTGFAMRAYAQSTDSWPVAEPGPRLMLEFSRDLLPSYGWAFPVGGNRINIGVGGPLDVLRHRSTDLSKLLDSYVVSMRARGIEVGKLEEKRAYHLPHIAGMPTLTYPRAALIGDAASMINPVSGEGIAYAVTAAVQLVEALPEKLDDGDMLEKALARFEHDFRTTYRIHFASSRATLRLLRSPVWSSVLVRSMQRDPQVLSDAIDMLFGFGRFHLATALRVLNPHLPYRQ